MVVTWRKMKMTMTSWPFPLATLLPLETGFQSCLLGLARAMSWSPGIYRFLLFHFMWFLVSKRENADPCSPVIERTPLLDPILVKRDGV